MHHNVAFNCIKLFVYSFVLFTILHYSTFALPVSLARNENTRAAKGNNIAHLSY